jgi:hypothetical protein
MWRGLDGHVVGRWEHAQNLQRARKKAIKEESTSVGTTKCCGLRLNYNYS